MSSRDFYSYRVSSVLFKSFYDRWYPHGSIKVSVPKDLELNPTVCLHWYMGDGHRSGKSITLHTENFKMKHVNYLIRLLEKTLYINSKRSKEKNKYFVIRLSIKDSYKFLEYIGNCPIRPMLYKWGK